MDNNATLLYFLVALNVMLPIVAVLRHCGARRIEIDHVATFSLGFLLYWILPIAIGLTGALRDGPGMAVWYSIFDDIQEPALRWFLLLSLFCYSAFLLGTYLGKRVRVGSLTKFTSISFDRRALEPLFWLAAASVAAFSFVMRGQLFTGYQLGTDPLTPDPLRSAFSALCTILMVLLLLDCTVADEGTRGARSFRRLLANRFFLLFLIASVLQVSLGMRILAVSGILMLCIYRSVFFQRFSLVNLLSVIGAGLALVGFVGVWRLGRTGHGLMENLATEPMYVSSSLIHFLASYRPPLLAFPRLLLSEFLNLVPTFLFPGKMELFLRPEDVGYEMFSPGGGLNSFFSFMINFRVIGTIGMLFMLGFGMAALKARTRSPLLRVMYIMISGWLGFSFFRDPFYVSIVKSTIEFSIIVPTLIVVSLHLWTRLMAQPSARDGSAVEGTKITA